MILANSSSTLFLDGAGMLAGGTGVTPMYQVANAILKNPADKTKITLLFANVSADDILIEDELTNLQALSPQFQVNGPMHVLIVPSQVAGA